MGSFQVFRVHNDAPSEDILTLACAAKSQKTLQDQISPSTPGFCNPLQQLSQVRAFTDASALLPPPPKRPCLLDIRVNSSTPSSSSPYIPQSSPLDRLSTHNAKPVLAAPALLPVVSLLSPTVVRPPPLKKQRGCSRKSTAIPLKPPPVPKKRGRRRPCKNTSANVSAPLKQAPVSKTSKTKDETRDRDALEGLTLTTKPMDRKTAQEMESTKHIKATESAKEKKRREYADKFRRS